MITVTLTTDLPTALALVYQKPYPTRTPKWIIRRGAQMQCGWYLGWPNAECTPQAEPGQTTTHTFHVPDIPTTETYWISGTNTCPPTWGAQQTVPIQAPGHGTSSLTPSCILGATTEHTLSPGQSILLPLDIIILNNGWPGLTLPEAAIPTPFAGQLTGSLEIWTRVNIGSASGTLELSGDLNAPNPSWPISQSTPVDESWGGGFNVTLPSPGTISIKVTNIAGPNDLTLSTASTGLSGVLAPTY